MATLPVFLYLLCNMHRELTAYEKNDTLNKQK